MFCLFVVVDFCLPRPTIATTTERWVPVTPHRSTQSRYNRLVTIIPSDAAPGAVYLWYFRI